MSSSNVSAVLFEFGPEALQRKAIEAWR